MYSSPFLQVLSDPVKRLRLSALAIPTLLSVGTIGYTLLADMHPFDAFYMTVITFSTVGYEEIGGHLPIGARAFTVVLIVLGMLLVAFTTASFIESIVDGGLAKHFGRLRLEARISELEDHWIICGYGRMGELVSRAILESKSSPPLVVVDTDSERIVTCQQAGKLTVHADATDEETLLRAGISRARGLVSLVATDAENVFICLTAREMNPSLSLIARASEERSERKLRRAGADKVVLPYMVGGHRISQAVLQPAVAEFLEFAAGQDLSLEMEQTVLCEGSPLIGVELRNSGLRSELDLIVLAVRRSSGEMLFNPKADTLLEAGDTLIALGAGASLLELNARAR